MSDPLRDTLDRLDAQVRKYAEQETADAGRREWALADRWRYLAEGTASAVEAVRVALRSETVVTHGRHCPCSACAREDWGNPDLAHCGMHGAMCPPVYAPIAVAPAPELRAATVGRQEADFRHRMETCACIYRGGVLADQRDDCPYHAATVQADQPEPFAQAEPAPVDETER